MKDIITLSEELRLHYTYCLILQYLSKTKQTLNMEFEDLKASIFVELDKLKASLLPILEKGFIVRVTPNNNFRITPVQSAPLSL